MTPTWLTDPLAALMVAVAGYCVGRLVYARLRHRDTEHDADVLHVLMGVAMAGMLASQLSFLNDHIWEAVFVLAAAWFAYRGLRAGRGRFGGHNVPFFLACAAMLYMYFAPIAGSSGSGGAGMPGMAAMPNASDNATVASRFPLLGLAFAIAMVGYAAFVLDRTPFVASSRRPEVGTPGATPPISATASHCGTLAPRMANCCHVAMSLTMAYLLVIML